MHADLEATSGAQPGTKLNGGEHARRYQRVRQLSERIAAPLSAEDCAIQTMPDVSPTRWHLAHTTWFFETFLLKRDSNYSPFDSSFEYLFNSYYNSVGQQFPRHRRGQISRPGLDRTLAYRRHVDAQMTELLSGNAAADLLDLLELGLQHEQQHQELMLTDIKHVLSCNPLYPAYQAEVDLPPSRAPGPQEWLQGQEQLIEIGHAGAGFAFDNESPRHKSYMHQHQLAARLVTNGEYLEFCQDAGYRTATLWLSQGWHVVQSEKWQQPLYWIQREGKWFEFTCQGIQPLDMQRPVCHVSYFEADAFARWAGVRLPTEAEWEFHAAAQQQAGAGAPQGGYADRLLAGGMAMHPESGSRSLLGDLWQWTSSQYTAYPGFAAAPGALGEYNGKFMCNQFVLRGGSCATSSSHIRVSYRNFFPPEARWQFSGIRLAR